MVVPAEFKRWQRPSRLARRRRGSFSITHLAVVLFLTVSTLCVMNVGGVLVDRGRQQRITDSVAEALGTFKARNMNAVTTYQHLTGELLSLVVVHHAVGGDNLDRHLVGDTRKRDRELRAAHQAAQACATHPPFAFDDVGGPVYAGEALLKAHRRLKWSLTYVYLTKATAAAMMAWPPTYAAGEGLAQIADWAEQLIHDEWKTLEQIRMRALALSPLKLRILNHILPESQAKLERLVANYPNSQRQLADQLEAKWGVEIHVLPSDRRLPIKKDPLAGLDKPPFEFPESDCECPSVPATNMREQLAKVTQLSRATFPWVNYHRRNLVNKMKRELKISRMGEIYFDHTAGVAKRMAVKLQEPGAQSLALFVLDDYEGPDKAYEPWVNPGHSNVADRSFGLTVLTGMPQRRLAAGELFLGQPTSVSFRMATAITWNRHRPKQPVHQIDLRCKRIVPTIQAETGWDTLNWDQEKPVSELVGIGIPHTFPSIKPSWTSQLSPTSAARIDQIRKQSLPGWAVDLPKVLPADIQSNLVEI